MRDTFQIPSTKLIKDGNAYFWTANEQKLTKFRNRELIIEMFSFEIIIKLTQNAQPECQSSGKKFDISLVYNINIEIFLKTVHKVKK